MAKKALLIVGLLLMIISAVHKASVPAFAAWLTSPIGLFSIVCVVIGARSAAKKETATSDRHTAAEQSQPSTRYEAAAPTPHAEQEQFGESPQSAHSPVPPSPPLPTLDSTAAPVPAMQKIGGWLLFYCVCAVIVEPIVTLVNLAHYPIWASIFIGLPLGVLHIGSGFLLWRRNPNGLRWVRWGLLYQFSCVLFLLLLHLLSLGTSSPAWTLSFVGTESSEVEDVVKSLIPALIWWKYFRESQRVRATFGHNMDGLRWRQIFSKPVKSTTAAQGGSSAQPSTSQDSPESTENAGRVKPANATNGQWFRNVDDRIRAALSSALHFPGKNVWRASRWRGLRYTGLIVALAVVLDIAALFLLPYFIYQACVHGNSAEVTVDRSQPPAGFTEEVKPPAPIDRSKPPAGFDEPIYVQTIDRSKPPSASGEIAGWLYRAATLPPRYLFRAAKVLTAPRYSPVHPLANSTAHRYNYYVAADQASKAAAECASGKPEACEDFADDLLSGIGIPHDYAGAMTLYVKACDAGNKVVCESPGSELMNDAQAAVFVTTYIRDCDAGNRWACESLGSHFEFKDKAQSVFWFLRAAELGDADAQKALALDYFIGEGVSKDDAQAAFWYRKAAEQGDADAQFELGERYDWGSGVPKDYAQSASWYRKAAEQGDKYAQSILAADYDIGEGVPKDNAQAAYWYRRAADQGDADAQLELGERYNDGRGVPKDYAQAALWYRKAAEQGNADAQDHLGYLYYYGKGVPKDYAQAAFWLRKRAEHGDVWAQRSLGFMYHNGQGAPQDYAEAYFWLDIASSGKMDGIKPEDVAKERDDTAAHLTRTVLLQTQERARKWFEDHSPKTNPE
jgi:TPR repeat protein